MRKLVDKYNSFSEPVKASMWFVICSIVQRGISMITTPVFTRILTTEEYGVISVYNSWLSLLTIFATMELATGVFNKAMIKYEDDRDGYTSSTLFLASCITLAMFLGYVAGRSFWNDLLDLSTTFVIMLFAQIFFTTALQFWNVRRRFEFQYRSIIVLTLGISVIGSILSVVFVLNSSEYRAEMKILGTLITYIIVCSIVFVKIFKDGKKIIAPNYWKYAICYNLPLIPHYLSQQILNESDRIMINKIRSAQEAALYTVSYQVAMLMNIVTNAVHSSFAPWAYQRIRDREYEKIGEMTIRILSVMALVCFFISLFSPEVILFLGGKVYYEAIWIVPSVTMSIIFNMLYSLIGNFAFYFEKTKFVMAGTMIAAVANIVLNAIFIPKFGFIAAGYTTLACYILYSVIHYVIMIRICKQNGIVPPFNGKIIWGTALLSVLLSIVSTVLYNYTVIRYVVAGIVFLILFMRRKELIKIINFKKED